jgi:hypothetical protein
MIKYMKTLQFLSFKFKPTASPKENSTEKLIVCSDVSDGELLPHLYLAFLG